MEHVKRIETPADIAQGVDGPAWIELKTRVKGKYRKVFNNYRQLMVRMAATNTDNLNGNMDKLADASERFLKIDQQEIPKLVAALLVNWNWRDSETGEALPLNVETIEDELDQFQSDWIIGQIQVIMFNRTPADRVTEGNVPSGIS